MIEHYQRTFVRIQLAILTFTAAIFFWSRIPGLALVFFAAMQGGSLVGAAWGARLKGAILRHSRRTSS